MKWYKRDPDAALSGMAELTLEERGAYNSLIDLLYSRDGHVPDDDVLVARMIRCHWREWRRMKARLLARGKIKIEAGCLTARRVQEVLREAAEFSQKQRKNAESRWRSTPRGVPRGNASTSTKNISSLTYSEPRPAREAPAEPPKDGRRGEIPITSELASLMQAKLRRA